MGEKREGAGREECARARRTTLADLGYSLATADIPSPCIPLVVVGGGADREAVIDMIDSTCEFVL